MDFVPKIELCHEDFKLGSSEVQGDNIRSISLLKICLQYLYIIERKLKSVCRRWIALLQSFLPSSSLYDYIFIQKHPELTVIVADPHYPCLLFNFGTLCIFGSDPLKTHRAIWWRPLAAAACRGVQPSSSFLLILAPCWINSRTITKLSSRTACNKIEN